MDFRSKKSVRLSLALLVPLVFVSVALAKPGALRRSCQWLAQAHWANPIHQTAKLGRFFRGRWVEMREEAEIIGKSRYLFAARGKMTKSERATLYFFDPLVEIPYDLASLFKKYLTASKRPFRTRLGLLPSLPLSVMSWWGIITLADYEARVSAVNAIEFGATEGILGARALGEWVTYAGMPHREAQKKLMHFEKSLLNHQLSILAPRIQSLVDLGVVENSEVSQIYKFATKAIDKSIRNGRLYDEDLSRAFKELRGAAKWETPSDDFKEFYWSYLFLPEVQLEEKPEIYWLSLFFDSDRRTDLSEDQKLALVALDRLYEFHGADLPGPALVQLIARSLSSPDVIDLKHEKAKMLEIDQVLGPIVFRVDLPIFTGPLKFRLPHKSIKMLDELDRWNTLFNQFQFEGIKDSFLKGEISDLSALSQMAAQISALDQVYELYNLLDKPKLLTDSQVCLAVFGNGDFPAVTLLRQFEDVYYQQANEKYSESEKTHLLFALTNNYYQYLIESGEKESTEDAFPSYEKMLDLEDQLFQNLDSGTIEDFVFQIWRVHPASCKERQE